MSPRTNLQGQLKYCSCKRAQTAQATDKRYPRRSAMHAISSKPAPHIRCKCLKIANIFCECGLSSGDHGFSKNHTCSWNCDSKPFSDTNSFSEDPTTSKCWSRADKWSIASVANKAVDHTWVVAG